MELKSLFPKKREEHPSDCCVRLDQDPLNAVYMPYVPSALVTDSIIVVRTFPGSHM